MYGSRLIRAPAVLLAVSLVLALAFPAPGYAGLATPADAAIPGDPLDDSFGGFDDGDYRAGLDGVGLDPADSGADDMVPSNALLAEPRSIGSMSNTVPRGYLDVGLQLRNTNTGVNSWPYTDVSNSGYFRLQYGSGYSFEYLILDIPMRALPYDGIYDLKISYTFDVLPTDSNLYSGGHTRLRSSYKPENLSTIFHDITYNYDFDSVISYPGALPVSLYYSSIGSIEANQAGDVNLFFDDIYVYHGNNSMLSIPLVVKSGIPAGSIAGYVAVQWTKSSATSAKYTMAMPSSAEVDSAKDNTISQLPDAIQGVQDAVDGVASAVQGVQDAVQDVVEGITNLPQNIADSLEPHYDNILTQLHHITEQLHAFWDQLAAYFNDRLIPQMVTDTDRIVEAIENIDLNVDVSFTELIKELQKQHQEHLANDNENTEKILNSYDNSGMESTNEKLEQAIDGYDEKEAELFDSVQGYLNDFQYEDPFQPFTAPLEDLSYLLTGIYTGLGPMNIPIAFSLTLSIGLICIGWYRFKGG